MKKIFLILFTFTILISQAQVKFKVRVSNSNVSTDDRLRISFIAEGNSNQINNAQIFPPSFNDFRAMGPFVSQEFNYINGKSTYKKSHTYTLQPLKTGELTIPSAKMSVDGKTYTTKPVTIHVTKGVSKPKSSTNNGILGNNGTNQTKTTEAGKDILLVAQVTNENPYENQAIGLTYKLYIPRNYGVQNYQEITQPQYNGFWAQDVDKTISGPFEGTINGKDYIYYVLKKKLLFAQQTGKLTIKPLNLSIDIQKPVIRQMGWARFRDIEIQRIKLSSGKKTINVKPLPTKKQPIDFTGAVGNFNFKVQVDNNQIATGNPVNVKVEVNGTGNLKLFNLPKLQAPNGLEVYDPKHTENVKTTFSGNRGTVKDEYIVIPNQQGKYILPGMRFTYFNTKTKQYEVKTTDDIVIFAKGKNNYSQNQPINENYNNNNLSGNDFRFIKEKTKFISKNKYNFYQSKPFYYLILIAFLIAFLAFGYKKYLNNKVYDASYETAKIRKTLASKFLKDAKKSLGDKEYFYMNLEKAIHNFLKAKLHIDTSELSKDNITKLLKDKKVEQSYIDEIKSLLSTCEMARYTPIKSVEMNDDLRRAEELINQLNKSIK